MTVPINSHPRYGKLKTWAFDAPLRSCRPNQATRRNAPVFAHFTDTDAATIVILYPPHAELRRFRCAYRLPLQPVKRTVLRELQQRPMLQTTVHRQQKPIDGFMTTLGMGLLQRFQANGLRQCKRPGFSPAQLCNMGAATEQMADILDQGADIGAFCAIDRQARLLRLAAQ